MKQNIDAGQINAFVDGELGLESQLEIERQMRLDPDLRERVDRVRQLQAAVRDRADYHEIPPALRERLDLLVAAKAAKPAGAPRFAALVERWWSWRPVAASLALVGVGALTMNIATLQLSQGDRLLDEVVASHVRSTLGQHLVDVASSDHHTVKPFLSARLGFSPPVHELPVPGSVFLGGRVDYLGGQPVAALVYRQGQHVVNTFVWPDSGRSDSAPEFSSERGFLVAHWSQGGMRHCVISDVNREEFRELVNAVRSSAATG